MKRAGEKAAKKIEEAALCQVGNSGSVQLPTNATPHEKLVKAIEADAEDKRS